MTTAQALAETDAELAAVLAIRGMNASDNGSYPAAFAFLDESVERALRCDDDRQQAWSLSIIGRARLLRGEHSQATVALTRSLELVHEQRWMAFLPWPQALRAELDLRAGRLDTAADGFERSWVLACQVGDPCWEGMAARGLALLNSERGDHVAATGWLGEAATRCVRVTDRYQWVHGHVLDTMIATALDRDDRQAATPLIADLGALAARCGMRELVVRTELHRSRLGDRTALASARLLGADIDNPVLASMLAGPPTHHATPTRRTS